MSTLPRRDVGRDTPRFGPDPRRSVVPSPRRDEHARNGGEQVRGGTPTPRPAATDRIAELEAQLAAERRRADQAEQKLASRASAEPEGSFGMRAERLLRLAEAEARDMRSAAARDATALLERTQAEAETHRHEVEQELISRSAAFDRRSAEREAALVAREQQLAEDLAAHRQQVERLKEAAQADAERIRRDATVDAQRTRAVAEEAGRQLRAEAQADADRLRSVQDQTRRDLAMLGQSLAGVLGAARQAADGARGAAADGAGNGSGNAAGGRAEATADA
jgi:hypothetical protein